VPNGKFQISESAFNAHGISTEKVFLEGKSTKQVIDNFIKAIEWADLLICHNVWFDQTLINSEIKQIESPFDLLSKKHFCTMEFLTPIVKAMPMRYGKYKWPKLEEAMQFFFGRGVEGAHDALNDVRATVELFFEIQKRYPQQFNNALNSLK
jgi:DNA polymerase-3 subunit epsilon